MKKQMSKDAFSRLCHQNGIKVTPQRTTIYEIVARMDDHPCATEVYEHVRKRFPNISFDTVNRTLLAFVDIGLLARVPGSGEARRFDLNLEPHHHARCTACNQIIDVDAPELDRLPIPDELSRYRVTGHKVVFDMICEQCVAELDRTNL